MSSASLYDSSGLQFFRTTHGIQSGAGVSDESRFVMTFLILLGVTKILYSFELAPEGKTAKEITASSRLEFLEKILANNFVSSDAEKTTPTGH